MLWLLLGFIYRMLKLKVVLLIFLPVKMVLTNKNRKDAHHDYILSRQ
jgi:TATA-box binding protein (TBP) (component of TFIID and TFIIIB)